MADQYDEMALDEGKKIKTSKAERKKETEGRRGMSWDKKKKREKEGVVVKKNEKRKKKFRILYV